MRRPVRLLIVSVAAFVVLGMPKSAFGVAWPSVAEDILRPVADLGLIITVYVVGYFVAAVTTGFVMQRLPVGSLLFWSSALATASLAGYAAASGWIWLLVAAAGLGLAGGFIDAGVNALVAVRHGARAMGMLHAGFGIGATLGPLMMTALVASERSWRAGFATLAVLQGILVLIYLRTRGVWSVAPADRTEVSRLGTGRRTALWGALVVFGLYSGVEVGAGQWAFTLLTEGRGITPAIAGAAVTAFWAGLTVARLGLGIIGHRISVHRVLGSAAVLVVIAAFTFWINPSDWSGVTALVVLGVALGPIFPLQTTLTPERVGLAYTPTAVGYQLAAATVGAALIPGGLGLLVSWWGIEAVGPVLTATAVLMAGSIGLMRRMGEPMPAGDQPARGS
jgi:fucose permease